MKLLKEKQSKGSIYNINACISDLDETFKRGTLNEDSKTVETRNPGQIEKLLDRVLKVNKANAKRGMNAYVNVLFEGPAGTGKTSRVLAWAKANDINLVMGNASTMEETDLGGAIAPDKELGVVRRYSTIEFDQLDKPNSVLFLDELNRAPSSVTGTLLTLIQNHTVIDPRVEGRMRKLKGFLFTIAAINPSSTVKYDVEALDQAMLDRFAILTVKNDPEETRNYLVDEFTHQAELAKAAGDEEDAKENLGRAAIADALLSHPDFSFELDPNIASSEDKRLEFSSRSIQELLMLCDGTKDDFLNRWDLRCYKAKKPMAERILKSYHDIDDKANDALKNNKTDSDLFKKRQSISDQLFNALDNMDF